MEFEVKIIEFLQSNALVGWITFFQIITLLGSYLGFLITFILLFCNNRKLSYAFIIGFCVVSVFNFCLKLIIKRDRPFVDNDTIANLDSEDGFSMPSGHSMSAAFYATFLIFLFIKTFYQRSVQVMGSISAILMTLFVAFSRMVLGVHYLTDTIVGMIVGIIFAIITILVYNTSRKKVKQKFENKQ